MTYLLMTLLGLLAFVLVLARTEHKAELLAVSLVAGSLIAMADWIVFGWFHLYAYHPHLLARRNSDDALGEFLAEFLFLPALCGTLLGSLPGVMPALVGTALVTGIEFAFVRSGIFARLQWRLWYTTVAFFVYFQLLTGLWRSLAAEGSRPDWLPLLLRLSAQLYAIALLTLFLRPQGWVHTNIHTMPTPMGNQAFGRFITYACLTVPLGLWVCGRRGAQRWIRLGLVTLGLMIYNVVLTRLNFQFFLPPWSGPLDALAQGVAIGAASLTANAILDRLGMAEQPRVRT